MRNLILFLIMACTVLISCSLAPTEVAGGSTSTPNEVVLGFVNFPAGTPAARSVVQLIPSSYIAVGNAPSLSLPTDTTDTAGAYRFAHVKHGTYNIQAVHIDSRERALITGITADTDTVRVSSAVLEPAGNLIVIFSDSFYPVNGYFYIPGTTIAKFIDGIRDTLVLDSVPAGIIQGVYYSTMDGSENTVLRYNVRVPSGDTVTIENPMWKFSRRIYLNTSKDAAAVTGNVTGFPVLIRLTDSNFTFSQAQTHGEDLRFTKSDNTPLPHEVEQWDANGGTAAIWVKVDTVYGNNSTQSITMYWGNHAAGDYSNSASVFDTADGFQGVWHLAEAGNTMAKDATANHFDGTPAGMSATSAVEGAIGGAQVFDGIASCLTMANTASGTLNFSENGPYTISTWIRIDTLDSALHTIISKGNRQYSLGAVLSNEWEFSVCPASGGWDITNASATSTAWTYLVGIRNGAFQYLYINGVCIDSTATNRYSGITRYTGDDLNIGKCPNDSLYFFNGIIDEVSVSGVVRDPAWIKLSYMNQKMNDKLITFR